GGQKQRVAIAGVIAMEPKCIVLDEPTAMLDPMGRKEVLKTVQKLREQKKVTVILITHYMEEVVDADKIY
ncbi:ATP-binding cassette domain-containing protein, partial [Agathobaculum butyriciproducens]|nr:ATP-binding cassette domain-containing protein [Agathobaculum butyriciproducens]